MNPQPLTACKQYCLAAGATQGNIAYSQTVIGYSMTTERNQPTVQKTNR
jgi:hypothetical protein